MGKRLPNACASKHLCNVAKQPDKVSLNLMLSASLPPNTQRPAREHALFFKKKQQKNLVLCSFQGLPACVTDHEHATHRRLRNPGGRRRRGHESKAAAPALPAWGHWDNWDTLPSALRSEISLRITRISCFLMKFRA